ncbi:MAG: sigma-70 family RNA polymerase sigma factor [Acidobacteriota bacterium]
MSGEDIREEEMLAAVKPLQTADSPPKIDKVALSAASKAGSGPVATVPAGSLEDLFQQHHGRVFRTAYRLTGSAADAEDVLQTVFLRLARGQESAGIATNPEAYVTRAAINASLDLLRKRKRAGAVQMDDVEDKGEFAGFVTQRNPETYHEDRELRELIREAVSRLGPTAAQMFTLRYFEGMDNGEIAQSMSTSALVVAVTLHRARTRLRKEIGSYLQQHSSA